MYRSVIVLLLLAVFGNSIDPLCTNYQNVRTFDGFCNNLNNPNWGRAGTPERRLGAANYQDGKTVPVNGPNARTISQKVFALPPQIPDVNKTFEMRQFGPKPDARDINMFAVMTLQFITHDIAFTPLIFDPEDFGSNFGVLIENCTPETSLLYDELCLWPYPGDPNALEFPQTALFTRPSLHTLVDGVFTPLTNVSGFIDLSTIYGSDNETSYKVRSFVDGKLLEGPNGEALPRASDIGVENDCAPFVTDGSGAGDIRVDENTGITTLHVAFNRYHNYLCDRLKSQGVTGDQNLYKKARDLNIAVFQHIVYDELIPDVFGEDFVDEYLGDYNGYKPATNPSVQIEGTTAGFRFHNMINLPFLHVNNTCALVYGVIEVLPNIPVKIEEQDNCHPERFREVGSEIVVRGLTIQAAQKFTPPITDALRNLRLLAPGNVDIGAADIFRGRLHGLPNYDDIRVLYGRNSVYDSCTAGATVDPIECFKKVTPNNTLAASLRTIYSKVNKIDAVVGIHSEKIKDDSSVTETAAAIELTQLKALRDGDRFFWRSYLNSNDKDFVKSKNMKDVLVTAFPSLSNELREKVFFVNKHHNCYIDPQNDDDDDDDDDDD